MHNLLFSLLHLSIIFVFSICLFLLRIKNKKQIHYVFLGTNLFALLWSLGNLLEAYTRDERGQSLMIFVYLWYLGLCFIPVFILLTGIIFAKTKITLSRYYLLFLPPITSFILLLTNSYHHLFFKKFSGINSDVIYGKYFIFHSIYSYSCIIIGLIFLLFNSIKHSKFFSRQSILIVIGSFIPLIVNVAVTLKLVIVPGYTTAISFSFAMVFFAFAIFRYNFLSVAPIALQKVVDKISDGFLVVNEEVLIVDFNKTAETIFKGIVRIERNKSFEQIYRNTCLISDDENAVIYLNEAKELGKSVSFQKHIQVNDFDKYFTIEITPILSKGNYLGSVVLFKDITETIKNIETIEEKHAIMMEQERLASLGQLIGGIAHNLKTPIMSIAGAVEGLRDLTHEYESSIGDASVSADDHHEIVADMRSWLDKIKPYCSYMSDIIDTVKGQATQLNASSMLSFTVNELIKRIELLLKYELIKNNCKLNVYMNDFDYVELYGDVNSLVQVFDNIIINAIHAYEGKSGVIELIVEDKKESILFKIKDYAKGISENIKNKLLKEMVTTKGRDGTGLGLYMSHSTIKGRFEGRMWFDSAEGKGTTFYIQLPHK